jgi:hypothetical protein
MSIESGKDIADKHSMKTLNETLPEADHGPAPKTGVVI